MPASRVPPSFVSSGVHIVLCAYAPDLSFFRSQCESLRAQTYEGWTCEIRLDGGDDTSAEQLRSVLPSDPRFTVVVNSTRLGVFHNFEAGVAAAPPSAKIIAYCDQDDEWLPDKLATIAAAFDDTDVVLVHSDLSVVDSEGRQLQTSCFEFERRVIEDLSLPQLVLRNAVTGCACAFRSEIVPHLLPFPSQGTSVAFHHDLWTALIATQCGLIRTIRRPLVRYRQHDRNVIGAENAQRAFGSAPFKDRMHAWLANYLLRETIIRELLARPAPDARVETIRDRAEVARWLRPRVLDLSLVRRALSLHLRGYPAGRVALRVALGKSIAHRPRVFTALRRAKTLLGMPNAWTLAALSRARSTARSIAARGRVPSFLRNSRAARQIETQLQAVGSSPEVAKLLAIEQTYSRPLAVSFTEDSPRAVIAVPTGRMEHMFGGLATAFKFGAALAERGIPVRFLTTDHPIGPTDVAQLRAFLADRCGLTSSDPGLVTFASSVDGAAPSHRRDLFIATIWWSARRIFQTLQEGGFDARDFYYFIQDFEPGFYAWSDEYALAESTYRLPCRPIVNTRFLADHLQRTVGLIARDELTFAPEIDWTLFHPPSLEDLSLRTTRRIFLYGRPHTPRNLFGIAVMALRHLIRDLKLTPHELEVVSAGELHDPVALGAGVVMLSSGKMDMSTYASVLRSSDIGLSLMLSPHPSYPPFEMAASGLTVVTNEFSTKQMTFSDNFVSAAPGPEAILAALKTAWNRSSDGVARIRGSQFDLAALGRPLGHVASEVARELKSRLTTHETAPPAAAEESRVGLSSFISHGASEDFRGQRVCLFSQFDAEAHVDRHVLYYLHAIKAAGFKVVLISSNPELSAQSQSATQKLCTAILHRENRGFDFAGWALAMEAFPSIMSAEEILLANDSVYGPVRSLSTIFDAMRTRPCDFWGLTESLEKERHLQSYFLVFKRSAIATEAFRRWWSTVRALPTKDDVIDTYEVSLTRLLSQAGLRPDAFIPFASLGSDVCNPTLRLWRTALLDAGLPFIKVQLLRDNPLNDDIDSWDHAVESLGYDPRLIVDHLSRVAPHAKCLARPVWPP